MPDVRRNGIDLQLRGDKIRLESRPASREGVSRPVSALTLYNTPKEEHAVSRRPRSADDNKEALSSAELLKSLVSQPIVSWRNGSAELSPNYKSDDGVLNAPACQLTPGLTGKPPLPMVKREKRAEGRDGNGEREDFDGDGYAKELEGIASRLSGIENGANAPDNHVRYQNWITDKMVEDAERRTDFILNQIHQQQTELIHQSPRKNTNQHASNLNECNNDKPQRFCTINDSVLNEPEFNLNNERFNEIKTKSQRARLNSIHEERGELSFRGALDDADCSSLKSESLNNIHNNLNGDEKVCANHKAGINNKSLQKPALNYKSKANSVQESNMFSFNNASLSNKNRQMSCEKLQRCQTNEPKIQPRNKMVNHKNYKAKLSADEDTISDDSLESPLCVNGTSQRKSPASISFEKFFSDVPAIDLPSEKIITLSERPLEKNPKCKNAVVRKPKNGVKFSPKVLERKPEAPKAKFTPKTMRMVKDVEDAGALDEEVSWMSRPEKTEKEIEVLPSKDVVDEEDDDEIAAILEVLEAESQKSQSKIQSIKNIVSSELNATINSIPPQPVARNEDPVENKSSALQDANCYDSKQELRSSLSSSSIASNNYKDILSFLDEVDKNSIQSINTAKDRIAVAAKLIDGSLNLDSMPRLEDLLANTPAQLANEIVDLNLRLKEKTSAIRTLQEELSSLREQVIRSSKQAERIVKEKLRAQKDEADATVRRHQKFIDQLIGEKKALGQQCENLVVEMRMMEERFSANAKAQDHRHQVELQKMKDMHIAGEKIRRERWLDTKTQKIKEMTVKSIEPEIQSMTVRHEQELADLRSFHKREIEDIEMKNARKMQQQCEAIRAQMTEEREKALAHEREVMRLRYESMVESEEKSYQDQRKRLMQEHAHRMEECQAREEAAVAEKERALKQLHDEYEDKIQCIVRRHANEVKISRESAELEAETWRNNCRKQLEAQLAAKEASLREQLRRERDREIELVIERLETESSEARAQLEAVSENRIRRLRDKYEKEMKDLELSENDAKAKYAEMKGRLLENEELVIGLKAGNKKLEHQLNDSQQLCEKLALERQSMKQNIEQEVRGEISGLEKEIEKIKDDRDAELQQVYSRVKVAVARKDETIGDLSRDNVSLKEKCKYLESMLEQQRKEYLIK